MNTFIIDFESYFDKDYGLTKMMMCEYILDKRFDTYMVGVRKVGSDKTHIILRNDIQKFFDAIDPANTILVAHNAFFDGFITEHVFNFHPARWICTSALSRLVNGRALKNHSLASMSKHLGVGVKGKELAQAKGVLDPLADPVLLEALSGYCRTDCDLTHDAMAIMLADPQVTESALDIIDWTIRAYCRPTLAVRPRLALDMYKTEKANKQLLVASSGLTKKELGSTAKLRKYFESQGVAVPMKEGKNGPIPALAKTDAGMRTLLEHDHAGVRAVAAARLGVKSTLLESRLERMTRLGTLLPGSLAPLCLKAFGAMTTGRFSGSDKINPQNMPKGEGGLRSLVTPPKDYQVMAVDSSNIEPRVADTLCGNEAALDVYRSGGDIYLQLASQFYGEEVTADDKPRRTFAKIMKLSLGYGSGAAKFKDTCKNWANMEITEEAAKEAVDGYRRLNPHITDMWKRCDYAISMMANKSVPEEGYWLDDGHLIKVLPDALELPNGFKIKYPNIRSEQVHDDKKPQIRYGTPSAMNSKGTWTFGTKLYGAMVFENICQALAGAIIGEQLLAIDKIVPVAFMVHDEVVSAVPTSRAQELLAYSIQMMSTPPAWMPNVPLNAEGDVAASYALCK